MLQIVFGGFITFSSDLMNEFVENMHDMRRLCPGGGLRICLPSPCVSNSVPQKKYPRNGNDTCGIIKHMDIKNTFPNATDNQIVPPSCTRPESRWRFIYTNHKIPSPTSSRRINHMPKKTRKTPRSRGPIRCARRWFRWPVSP